MRNATVTAFFAIHSTTFVSEYTLQLCNHIVLVWKYVILTFVIPKISSWQAGVNKRTNIVYINMLIMLLYLEPMCTSQWFSFPHLSFSFFCMHNQKASHAGEPHWFYFNDFNYNSHIWSVIFSSGRTGSWSGYSHLLCKKVNTTIVSSQGKSARSLFYVVYNFRHYTLQIHGTALRGKLSFFASLAQWNKRVSFGAVL